MKSTDAVSDVDAEKTLTKLAMAANHYMTTNPGLSRYYMSELNEMRHALDRQPPADEQRTCPYCHAILRPGQYMVRVTPKRKVARLVERLRRKKREGQTLGRLQEKVLDDFENSRNRVVTHCDTCGKDDMAQGGGRDTKILKNIKSLKSKVKKTQKRSSSEFTVPKFTKSKKKGQKKGQQEKSLNDSGLAESLSSASRTDSLSVSTISSVDLDSSVYSTSRLSSGSAPITSTPKLHTRSTNLGQKSVSTDSLASFLSSIQSSPGSTTQNKGKQRGKKNKKNKGMSVLQRMLHQQERESANRDNRLNSLLKK